MSHKVPNSMLHIIADDKCRESLSNRTKSEGDAPPVGSLCIPLELIQSQPTHSENEMKKVKSRKTMVKQYDQHGNIVRVKKVKVDENGNPIRKKKTKKGPLSPFDTKGKNNRSNGSFAGPINDSGSFMNNNSFNMELSSRGQSESFEVNNNEESLSNLLESSDSVSTMGHMSAAEVARQNYAGMVWNQQSQWQYNDPSSVQTNTNHYQQQQQQQSSGNYQYDRQGTNREVRNTDDIDKFEIFAQDFDGQRPRSGRGANIDKMRMFADSFPVSAEQFSDQYEVEGNMRPNEYPREKQYGYSQQQGYSQRYPPRQPGHAPASSSEAVRSDIQINAHTHALVVQYMISSGADPYVAEQMACDFEEAQRRGIDSYASPGYGSSAPDTSATAKDRSHDIDKFSMFSEDDENSVSDAFARALSEGAARAEGEQNEQITSIVASRKTAPRSKVSPATVSSPGSRRAFNMPIVPLTPEEQQLSTRTLLIQYLISVGTDPDIAEQMADEFNEQQESESGATPPLHQNYSAAHQSVISEQQLGAIESFHHKHMEAMNGGYRQQQSAPIGNATFSQGPMSHSMPAGSSDGRPIWHRADRPGAVEMEGRAFGAPRRTESRQSESYRNNQNNGHHEELDVEADIAARGYIEAVPVSDKDIYTNENIVYAESSTFGLKHILNERPVRRLLALICVLIVGVTVVATVIALKGSKGTKSGTILSNDVASLKTSESPSSSPTFIADDIAKAAAAISGFASVLTQGTPQRRAVGWLSSQDEFDTQGLELIFFQRYIMTVLYFAMNGEQWLQQEKWLSPTLHVCDWSFGISCGTDLTRRQIVTGIDLTRNGVSGKIPIEVSQMDSLTLLRLAKNAITGTIPVNITQLTSLTDLDLSANKLTGFIPSGIGNLQDLLFLDLYDNLLTGTIPASVYGLGLLSKMDLSVNSLTGYLSKNVTNLVSLASLNLKHNQLKGRVPSFAASSKLEFIFLDNNQFTGSLPDLGIESVARVEFTISHNLLSGGFPVVGSANLTAFFERGYKIQRVDLSYNQLTGTIPALVAFISSLRYADVSGNRLTGSLPVIEGIGGWKNLEYFAVADNQFTGTIPVGFSNSLTSLDASNNRLTGGFPLELYSKFPQLELIILSNNPLGGRLSGLLGNLGALRDLHLSNCNLTGVIPDNLMGLRSLEHLLLDNNKIEGPIPPSMVYLTLLKELDVSNNNLDGSLPFEIGSLTLLNLMSVANNSLTGSLPSSLEHLLALKKFDVSGNLFTGEVPDGICANLEVTTTMVGCDLKCDCCSLNTTTVC